MRRITLCTAEADIFETYFPLKERSHGGSTHDSIPSDIECERLFFKNKFKGNKIEDDKIFIKPPWEEKGIDYISDMFHRDIKLYCHEYTRNGTFYGTLYSGTVAGWCSQTKSIVISRVEVDYKYTYEY